MWGTITFVALTIVGIVSIIFGILEIKSMSVKENLLDIILSFSLDVPELSGVGKVLLGILLIIVGVVLKSTI